MHLHLHRHPPALQGHVPIFPYHTIPRSGSGSTTSLRTLYDKYKADGFDLIAFPCNQFGYQAPGTSQEEREWAWKKFGQEFDVYDKIEVNGPDTHPLYAYLKTRQPVSIPSDVRSRPNGDIEWNYAKFLLDREGNPVKRYKPSFDPLNMEADVRLVLAGRAPQPAECVLHPGRKVCKVDLT
ncbi:hypothetical protein PLESTM_001892700 [Pleodorina starrii]|nr:hypothetical protein PLESTM_001892700 [Pleodorina starrii]